MVLQQANSILIIHHCQKADVVLWRVCFFPQVPAWVQRSTGSAGINLRPPGSEKSNFFIARQCSDFMINDQKFQIKTGLAQTRWLFPNTWTYIGHLGSYFQRKRNKPANQTIDRQTDKGGKFLVIVAVKSGHTVTMTEAWLDVSSKWLEKCLNKYRCLICDVFTA